MLDTAGYNVIMTRETDDDIADDSAKPCVSKSLGYKNRMKSSNRRPTPCS